MGAIQLKSSYLCLAPGAAPAGAFEGFLVRHTTALVNFFRCAIESCRLCCW